MTLTHLNWLRFLCLLSAVLAALAALAGLIWTLPGKIPASTTLYGHGLYRRDTPFVAGGTEGIDPLTLLIVVPVALRALAGQTSALRRVSLAAAQSWFLYVSLSRAFGAVGFTKAFPLYVLLIPLATIALALGLPGIGLLDHPRGLPAFLAACGIVTGTVWMLLLWYEMTAGAFPPVSYYAVRTTYALDLGIIAPRCLATALALWKGWPWGIALALPLLALAALLLPMMVAQHLLQIRAGVAFGPDAAIPLIGFTILSAGAAYFLCRLARTGGEALT